jgi:hypothetical protein
MLSGEGQDMARRTIDESREAAISDDVGRIRVALEQLEQIARMITDAMFRPTGLTPDADSKQDETAIPLSELS